MGDETHRTSFDQHAKRASVDLPSSFVDSLPFDHGADLAVRENGDEGVTVLTGRRRDESGAVIRESDDGPRLYVDRTVAYGSGLLDGEVRLQVGTDDLTIQRVD